MKLTELKCHNCGAPLIQLPITQSGRERYKCEHCGSQYVGEFVNGIIVYKEILPPSCKTYASARIIRDDYPIPESYIEKDLINSFYDAIKENVLIEKEKDWYTGDWKYTARLRIVPVNYKY